MGSACVKITKYFLFLFNLLFFILGAVILGFGVWILVDKSSFISVLQTSSSSLKVWAYVFISVGTFTMLMGFLGCLGAVNEVRCLLGLVKEEMGNIVLKLIRNYSNSSEEGNVQQTWDYVQAQVECCGWASFLNWTENEELMNHTSITYPCSCYNKHNSTDLPMQTGFCEVSDNSQSGNNPEEWPVYRKGCMERVQTWLQENLGIILGVCGGVAVIELLGMILSISLCRHIHSEDYSKVPKY
ncbi:PREDICTED: CD82 antigen isoform X2 [Elephantulus edwardii]|uniref:CD82 antigen isoform X2 n=1 Tax=Elephantulus edwardii TaxID=28737 RepID=UPI0003F0B80F|nr:PREDICTED: CD82 antigen isoform X2 [Elephantulus edwardii]